MRQDFTDRELNELAGGGLNFIWLWLPARGRSGGILLGVKDSLEVEGHEIMNFCIWANIRDRLSNFRWSLVIVYGLAYHDLSAVFLDELDSLCASASLPLLIGGDFNLIRSCEEKNSANYNFPVIRDFNNFIGKYQLREVARSGGKYTWTNKQLSLTLVTLDRFLMSDGWESKFPLTNAWSPTRVGSDHSPIILDSREQGAPRPRYFFFDSRWMLSPDFSPMIRDQWEQSSLRRPSGVEPLNAWHGSLCFVRQYLKGWNTKNSGE